MADRSRGDQNNGGNEADELLRELIPGSTQHGQQADPSGELPTWGAAQIPPTGAAAAAEEASSSDLFDSRSVLDGSSPTTGRPTASWSANQGSAGGGTESTRSVPPAGWPPSETTVRERRDPRWLTMTLGIIAGLALLTVAFQAGFAFGGSNESADQTNQAVAGDGDGGDSGDSGEPAAPTTADTGDAALEVTADDIDTESFAAGATTSSIRLSLEDYRFTIDGVVPSEEIKAGIEQRMGMVFAEFGTSTIAVDPEVEGADWLAEAPSLVNTMVLLHDGTIDITGDGVTVSGRALASDFAKLEGTFTPERGFPPLTISDQEVVDKEAPWVRAIATGDGTLTLTGELADETMRSTIVDGTREVYGAENVVDETTVNPERHNRFLIMRFPSNVAAYSVFGTFDIRGENESFTAILEDGLVFESLETELTPESRERLAGVMFTLTRNPLPVTVTGHTDSTGTAASNQTLSEQRAESVAAFLIENGVLPENIETAGLGEADPIADNDTDEGRARNRRVEIVIGLYN